MARQTWIGISSAALAAIVTGALSSPLWAAAPVVVSSASTGSSSASEWSADRPAERISSGDRRCTDPPANRATTPVAVSSAGSVTQSISVTVPRTAIVHLGADGSVAAAMTNTGCAPGPGDDVWVLHAGARELEPSSWNAFSGHRWRGDFSLPGVVVAQSGG